MNPNTLRMRAERIKDKDCTNVHNSTPSNDSVNSFVANHLQDTLDTEEVIEENTRSWSGDHSIDPDLVPGIFFSNWRLEDDAPFIGDMAPTVLNLFGLEPRGFHDGRVLNILNPN